MKKIIVILNASHTPFQLTKTAITIAKNSNSILEGLFLNDLNLMNFGYPFPNDLFLTQETISDVNASDENMKLLRCMANEFKDECERAGAFYKIEMEKSASVVQMVMQSRFADLIIADSKSDSDEYSIADLLADAHCPVLLVSPNAEPVEKVFLAYNGSASSMHAIKMFSYIFPEYKDIPTEFFQIIGNAEEEIAHHDEITLWASRHFSNITFQVIQGSTRKEIVEHIRVGSEKTIVVMGAYGRSAIARLFLSSTSASVIKETNASLFITHE